MAPFLSKPVLECKPRGLTPLHSVIIRPRLAKLGDLPKKSPRSAKPWEGRVWAGQAEKTLFGAHPRASWGWGLRQKRPGMQRNGQWPGHPGGPAGATAHPVRRGHSLLARHPVGPVPRRAEWSGPSFSAEGVARRRLAASLSPPGRERQPAELAHVWAPACAAVRSAGGSREAALPAGSARQEGAKQPAVG